jgi:MSHA pilin protein MshC
MVNRNRQTAFTLVELVLVIVIIGILGVVVAPRFFATSSYTTRGYFDELQSAVRYAQKLAIATQCPVQINISATSNRYDLYLPNDTDADPTTCDLPAVYGANPVRLPAGQGNFGRAAPSGVTITSPNLVVTFNAFGQPTSTGTVTVNGTRSFTIETETGYVYD